MKRQLFIHTIIALFFVCNLSAATVKAIGEAQIVNGDISSAKFMAESRAKWAALEQVAGVRMKVDTIINNAEILDEAVKTEVSSVINKFKILDEGKDGDVYWVQAEVEVIDEKAKSAMDGLTRNTAILVYLPVTLMDGKIVESNPFSEKVISELLEKGFDVIDVKSNFDDKQMAELDKAMKKNDNKYLAKLAADYMAGSMLIGKIVVIDKGNDVGYTTIKFNIVDGAVDYRLIGDKNGMKTILLTDTMAGRGQGATADAAAYAMMTSLGKSKATIVASKVGQSLLGDNKKSVRIVLAGNNDIEKLNALRDVLKNTAWVLNIKEAGIDTLVLDYPEKTLYLASILNAKGAYVIKKMSDDEIVLTK